MPESSLFLAEKARRDMFDPRSLQYRREKMVADMRLDLLSSLTSGWAAILLHAGPDSVESVPDLTNISHMEQVLTADTHEHMPTFAEALAKQDHLDLSRSSAVDLERLADDTLSAMACSQAAAHQLAAWSEQLSQAWINQRHGRITASVVRN